MRMLLLVTLLVATAGCAMHDQRHRLADVTRVWLPLGIPDDATLCIAVPIDQYWDCRTMREWRSMLRAFRKVDDVRYAP